MASVCIGWQCSEHQGLSVEVHSDAEHPDALDELASRAVKILRESLAVVTTPEES